VGGTTTKTTDLLHKSVEVFNLMIGIMQKVFWLIVIITRYSQSKIALPILLNFLIKICASDLKDFYKPPSD
jgi:hypothetical protein